MNKYGKKGYFISKASRKTQDKTVVVSFIAHVLAHLDKPKNK